MSRRVFLTGASSGIGRALAAELATAGDDLVLAARRVDAIETLCTELRARCPGQRFSALALDVNDHAAVFEATERAAEALGGLDLVIVNAGIASTGRIGSGRFERDAEVIRTNVLGAMATIDAAVARFRQQRSGHLVVISSVAAWRGLPTSGAYSASKAAIAVYADAARTELHGSGVRVTTLYPGYIDTPINEAQPSRPFLVDVETGARQLRKLIDRGVREFMVPVWPWVLVARLLRWLPTGVLARAMGGKR